MYGLVRTTMEMCRVTVLHKVHYIVRRVRIFRIDDISVARS